MAEPAARRWTYAEYLALEETSQQKHEFCDGVVLPLVVAMSGGAPAHADLCATMSATLFNGLRGRPCRTYSSDLRVRVEATSMTTYPDVTVICGGLRTSEQDHLAATNPLVLVEVLSPSTEGYDRGEKFRHYRRIPTLQDYVLVASQSLMIEVFHRGDDGSWSLRTAGPGERVAVASLGIELVVDEIYEGVELAPPSRLPMAHGAI